MTRCIKWLCLGACLFLVWAASEDQNAGHYGKAVWHLFGAAGWIFIASGWRDAYIWWKGLP